MADKLPVDFSSRIIRLKVTPVISTSAYLKNDAVGGLMEFTSAVLAKARGGTIQKAVIVDKAGQKAKLDLYLSDRTFTATADADPIDISAADTDNTLGVVEVSPGNYAKVATTSAREVATRAGLGMSFKLNGTSIFGQLITRGTPTYVATSDLVVILAIIPD